MTLKSFSGIATKAKLTGAITSGTITVPADNLTNWPTSGQFVAVIDPLTSAEEWVLCDSKTGTSQLNVNAAGRGYIGTAQSHNSNANVWLALDELAFAEANRFVNLMTAKGDLVGFDGNVAQRLAAGTLDGQVLRRLASGGVGLEWNTLGVLPPYTSTGTRDAAIPSPVDGQGCYFNSGDVNEGIQFWNGAAWRPPWNSNWGLVAQPVDSSATQTNLTSVTDITAASITLTAVTRRWYRYHVTVSLQLNSGSIGATSIQLCDGANTILAEWGAATSAAGNANNQHQFDFEILRQETAGSITRKLRCSGRATDGVDIGVVTPHNNTQFTIEDVGPVTGVPA